jgi:type IV pilus assembly protein PilO
MAIDINDLKKMPAKAKFLAVFLLILLICYLDWFYFLSSIMEKKSSLTGQVAELQEKIKEKEKVASKINQYMEDVKNLKDKFQIALLKLPSQQEIPTLFHSVAEAGKDAGVEFLLFEPQPVVPKAMEKQAAEAPKAPADKTADGKKAPAAPAPEPFYVEIPVAVQVVGAFPNILHFFDKVAKLSRIVNVSEISMGDKAKDAKVKGPVIMSSCMIKTYMFIEKKEKAIEKTSEKTK